LEGKEMEQPLRTLKSWSKADEKTLKKLFNSGLRDAEIGTKMDRSESSVKTRRMSLGLVKESRQSWTDEEKAKLLECHKQGMTDKQTGTVLKRSESSVLSMRGKLNNDAAKKDDAKVYNPALTNAEVDRIITLSGEGVRIAEIARQINRSAGAVAKKLRQAEKSAKENSA
jgi:DNA-binding NarL/FixJ family response regulator